MDATLRVLGISSRAAGGRLSAGLVRVVLQPSGQLSLEVPEPWSGTAGTDDARQLTDLRDAIANALDPKRPEAFDAVALKRVEAPFKGRPKDSYDKRVRFEAAVMVASLGQGCRYFDYRKNELGPGAEFLDLAKDLAAYPDDEATQEAVAAACAALHELREAAARGL